MKQEMKSNSNVESLQDIFKYEKDNILKYDDYNS